MLQHCSQSSSNLRTQGKAATIASYHVSHVFAKHKKKPFEDGDIVKKTFLEVANSFFEDQQ